MRNHTKSGRAELKLLHLLPRTKIIQNNLSDPKAWQRCAKGHPQSKRAFPALPALRLRCGVEYNCLALWNFLRNTGGRGHMGWEKPHPRDSRSSLWPSSPGPGMAKLGGPWPLHFQSPSSCSTPSSLPSPLVGAPLLPWSLRHMALLAPCRADMPQGEKPPHRSFLNCEKMLSVLRVCLWNSIKGKSSYSCGLVYVFRLTFIILFLESDLNSWLLLLILSFFSSLGSLKCSLP